jgi:hypothetical protein
VAGKASAGVGGVGTEGGAGGVEPEGGNGGSLPIEDPEPAEPDLTGLVPTSGKWLLVFAPAAEVPGGLAVYDVETGIYHDANPNRVAHTYQRFSPDRKTVALGTDGGQPLSVLRFADNGFVPATAIKGLEDATTASYYFAEWEASSRFFAIARGGMDNHGVEVVDAARAERVAHIPVEPAFRARFAPQGLYFTFYRPDDKEASITRVVKGGVSDAVALPKGTSVPEFSSDGARAFYTLQDAEGLRHQYFLELPDGKPQELAIAGAGETLTWEAFASPSPESALARVKTADSDLLVQVFVDGKPRAVLSDPLKKIDMVQPSADNNLLAISYEDGIDIVRIEPYARFALPGQTIYNGSWTTGVVGNYVYHQADGKVFVASIDAQGALSDVVVDEPGALVGVCGFPFTEATTTKLAYRVNKHEIAVLDLQLAPPKVAVRVTNDASHFDINCPHFSPDESSFAFLDHGKDVPFGIYGVKWNGQSAGEQKLLVEAAYLDLYAASF